jgi:dehydrogenase/reductase SDR family protein 7
MWILALLTLAYIFWKRPRKEIKGKNIVILGASSGIGRELAILLAQKNYVIVAARRTLELEELKKQIDSFGGRSDLFTCDWTDRKQLDMFGEFVRSKFDRVDHLILCAGVLSTQPFSVLSKSPNFEAVLEQIFRVNTFGPIMASRLFLGDLIASKGMITVISSAAAVMSAPTRTLYSSTKHALNGFFKGLRMEIASKGVQVCIVMPGSVQTDLRKASLDSTGDSEPNKGMTVRDCAEKTVEAMERGEKEVHLPRIYRLGTVISHLFPEWIDALARQKYKFQ